MTSEPFQEDGLIFNVGVDCEDVERWRKMLLKLRNGPQAKLFSSSEHRYCSSFKDPAPHYAARWCAKEALVKAVSPFCQIDLRKVEVVNHQDGRPYFLLNDPEAATLNLAIRVSLAHTRKTAMAVVMVASAEKAQKKY
jgi:phosphopantetheine--protein transferase-like protein